MNKKTKFNFLILISVLLILSGCKSGKPDMAYEQEDGGAVQDIKSFDVNATAENFRETSDQFAEDARRGFEAAAKAAGGGVWLAVAGLIVLVVFRVFSFYVGMIQDAARGI